MQCQSQLNAPLSFSNSKDLVEAINKSDIAWFKNIHPISSPDECMQSFDNIENITIERFYDNYLYNQRWYVISIRVCFTAAVVLLNLISKLIATWLKKWARCASLAIHQLPAIAKQLSHSPIVTKNPKPKESVSTFTGGCNWTFMLRPLLEKTVVLYQSFPSFLD